jgi:hypothetical protein
MPTFSLGGWPTGCNLQQVLDQARVHASTSNYNRMGSTTALQSANVAGIVNRRIEKFLEHNPRLGVSTSTQALTSGTNAYAVPTDLHGLAILGVRWNDSGDDAFYDLREITYLGPAGELQLPAWMRNGETTWTRPEFWTFNEAFTQIRLHPTPGDSTVTAEFIYRKEPTAISAANVDSPAAVTIGEVPTRFLDVLALGVGVELCERGKALRRELEARAWQALGEAQETITSVIANWRAGFAGRSMSSKVVDRGASFKMMRPLRIGGRGGATRYG